MEQMFYCQVMQELQELHELEERTTAPAQQEAVVEETEIEVKNYFGA